MITFVLWTERYVNPSQFRSLSLPINYTQVKLIWKRRLGTSATVLFLMNRYLPYLYVFSAVTGTTICLSEVPDPLIHPTSRLLVNRTFTRCNVTPVQCRNRPLNLISQDCKRWDIGNISVFFFIVDDYHEIFSPNKMCHSPHRDEPIYIWTYAWSSTGSTQNTEIGTLVVLALRTWAIWNRSKVVLRLIAVMWCAKIPLILLSLYHMLHDAHCE